MKISTSVQQTFFFFFYLGFLSRTFTIHRTAGEGGGYLFNSSLPLPPASRALRHWPGDCCGELTSAHSWQPDSNREPLVSGCKSLTTKLRALSGLLSFTGILFDVRHFKILLQLYDEIRFLDCLSSCSLSFVEID